jgi:hypothetical protein
MERMDRRTGVLSYVKDHIRKHSCLMYFVLFMV